MLGAPEPEISRQDPALILESLKKRIVAQVAGAAALGLIFVCLVQSLVLGPSLPAVLFYGGSVLICLAVLAVLRTSRRYVPGAWILFLGLLVSISIYNLFFGDRGGNLGYFGLAIVACFLMGARGFYLVAGAAATILLAFAVLDRSGWLPPNHPQTLPVRWAVFCVAAAVLARPLTNAVSGLVSALDAAWRELLERRRAEAALRESEQRFRAIFDSTTDAIVIHDPATGQILDANAAASKMSQYTRDELLALSLGRLTAYEIGFTPERALNLFRQSADGIHHVFEWPVRRSDGTKLWTEVSLSRVEFGGETRVMVVARDISERKLAEAERERLQTDLAQAQKMESIGRLAAGVAHDFNNLLTLINGYSGMALGMMREDDPWRSKMDQIHRAGESAAGLTGQLLAFSRKQLLQPQILNLNRLVKEMESMLRRLAGEDIDLQFSPDSSDPTVNADPHQLQRVLVNLTVNARDAMPGGGRLSIATAVEDWGAEETAAHPGALPGRYATLLVRDTGSGIDDAARPYIFEPFFTTKKGGEGTGLGLSMVQGFVTQSGGFIDVCSDPGQGTTFKISLPAASGPAAEPAIAAAIPERGGAETVLVVEDQAEVRTYVAEALKEYGYRAIPAANADEAVEACERERIHLVLTDVVMPNLSGRELAGRLKARFPGIKVLFMSGYSNNVIAQHGALEKGAHFIQKPFKPEDLVRKVRAVMRLPEHSARILVADDDAELRGFLRAVLETGGYEVSEAEDGEQAIQQTRAEHPNLVITDIVMPTQEGLETIQALRKDVPEVKIIAISGAFEGKFLKVAKLLGADAALGKPFSIESLLATVADTLKT